MQLHELKPTHQKKRKKRVGRGGKKGTYSGRGIKGQKARAGRKLAPMVRELIKRYPKLRGYRQNPKEKFLRIINLDVLDKNFKEGEVVTPKVLINRRILRKIKGRIPQVKILARGEIKKSLIVKGCIFSSRAREKLEKAGGKID